MQKTAFAVLAMACLFNGHAQSNLGLLFPGGLPVQPSSGTSFMMGGTGVGMPYEHNILLSNPANLGAIDQTVFSSLATIDFTGIVDEGRQTNHALFQPRQLSFGFALSPVGTFGLALTTPTNAVTKVRFGYDPSQLGDGELLTVDSIRQALSRTGGLTSWHLGWGRAFGRHLLVGLGYQRAYLTMNYTNITEVRGYRYTSDAPEFYSRTTRDSVRTEFAGNGFRMGIMVPFGGWTIGATGEYFFAGEATDRRLLVSDTLNETLAIQEYDVRLAPSFALGASYRFSPEWIAGAELFSRFWSHYRGAGSLARTDVDQEITLRAGGEFIPAPDVLSPRYWETMRYRAGLRLGGLPADGSGEWALAMGVGLPLRASGLVDIGIEFGQRWSADFEGYREGFFSLALGVNAGRRWATATRSGY